MIIPLFETRLNDDFSTTLVKESEFSYEVEILNSPKVIVDMVNCLFDAKHKAEENIYLIPLNTGGRALGVCHLSKGTINASLLSPREVFIRALLCGASNIVLIHNHPSSRALPSLSDIEITKQIREAGDLINVPLKDHLIIGGNSYYSFKEHELLR